MGKFETFAALHVPGNPVILYNIWDVGSALAVVKAGAKALATGSHPVGDASGFGDAHQVPIDFVFANARRIAEAVDPLPLTVDFEGAYSTDPEQAGDNVAMLARTGAVGCNFEDQVVGGEGSIRSTSRSTGSLQSEQRSAMASSSTPGPTCSSRSSNATMRWSIKSSSAAKRSPMPAPAASSCPAWPIPAISSGSFAKCRLPLNVIAFPGAPPKAEWAAAGVARISHGPFPHRALMAQLEEAARAAID